MKKRFIVPCLLSVLFMVACSSPKKDGASMGGKINRCNEDYLNTMNSIEAGFGNSNSYETRRELKQAYLEEKEQAYSDYISELGDIYKEMSERQSGYSYSERTEYENAVSAAIDSRMQELVNESTKNSELPVTVLAAMRSIIPPKPNVAQIQKDLIGHSLSEGVENGYYSSYWKWNIEEGEISNFNIESVAVNSSTEYQFDAKMRLTSKVGKAFDATVRVRYLLPDDDDWTIEFVRSQGMHIVKTHQYDDCVKCEKDGWWRYLKNNCEVTLEVGGRIFNCGGWEMFSHDVPPHGSYCLYNPDEVIIDYVERP